MENGILKEINTQNIFASQDKRFIYVPIIIDQTKVFDDLNIICHINKSGYTITNKKPTKVLDNNKSYDITFSEINAQFDTLSRKIFAKNISIKSGQKKIATKFLIQKVENPSQRETIYFTISKRLIDDVFKKNNESDQKVFYFDHYFSVYITNKKTGQIIENVKTGNIALSPYTYFTRTTPAESVLQDITENFFNSISISLTPYVEGFFLALTGLQFKYNQSMLDNINKLNPSFTLNVKNENDNAGRFSSAVGSTALSFSEFIVMPYRILEQKYFIQSIINSAANTSAETVDVEITLAFKYSGRSTIYKNKIFSLSKIKIINMARSFYSYHLDYYFGSANIFDDNSIKISNNMPIKITPNKDIVENSFIYEAIKNGKIKFIDSLNSNSVFNSISFDKNERNKLQSNNGFFLVKDILNKNINNFFIGRRFTSRQFQLESLIIEATIGTKKFRIYPIELPEVVRGVLSSCDETDFARSLIDSCQESD